MSRRAVYALGVATGVLIYPGTQLVAWLALGRPLVYPKEK